MSSTENPINSIVSKVKSQLADESAGSAIFYNHDGKNWYKSLPYAFKANFNGKTSIFYLPINPQNLQITTHFATNTVATLYSTVEEHSPQRYFDISIQGTTGFAPRYTGIVGDAGHLGGGRSAYQSGEVFSNLAGGFFQKTLGQLDQALNRASDAVAAIAGKSRPFKTGVFADNNGYVAFHNLYKFFLQHKKDASAGTAVGGKTPSASNVLGSAASLASRSGSTFSSMNNSATPKVGATPMLFINYKDGNQYSCAIQRFTLERSAENPMLYNYSIQLRAYNLSPIGAEEKPNEIKRLEELGLHENNASFAARFKGGIRNARQAVSSIRGAFGSLGRQ